MTGSVLLVEVEAEVASLLRQSSGEDDLSFHQARESQRPTAAAALPEADAIILGSQVREPLRLAQRYHSLYHDAAIFILSQPGHHEQLAQALRFTPFVGSNVQCWSTAAGDSLYHALAGAVAATRQRRRYRQTVQVVNRSLPVLAPATVSAEQYLSHLLDCLPVGVITVDTKGVIHSWNQHASRLLDQDGPLRLGASLFPNFSQEQEPALMAFIQAVKHTTLLQRFERRPAPGREQIIEATASRLDQAGAEPLVVLLLQDVTERVQAERAREQALLARDQFLMAASHELKTPITILKGYADLLLRRAERGPLAAERDLPALRLIQQEGARLARLIDRLVDLSQIEAGSFTLERERVVLDALLQRAVARLLSDLTGTEFTVRCPRNAVVVEGDPARLDQLLQILLHNAVRYSPEGSRITVQLRRLRRHAQIRITDQGIGIEPEALPHLFTRFYRGANLDRGLSGLGLGLYIVRHLVEAHGGTIRVESEPEAGSTFVVTLPLAEERPPPSPSGSAARGP